MRTLLLFGLLISFNSFTQTVYDFNTDPFTSGWNYYDDYSSSPAAGFTFDAVNGRINYQLNTTVDASFMHVTLPNVLSKDFCITFEITPTNANNYNTFFPLILTPYELTGTDNHPWREDPLNASTAGPVQTIDFLAIEVMSSQIRFFNHDGGNITPTSIMSMSPAFNMQSGTTYYIKLEIINTITAVVSIYSDAAFSNLLNTTTFNIPVLDDMTEMYISNSNGNTTCTQFGYVDNYRINGCTLGLEQLYNESSKEVVKIVDMLGREVNEITINQ